VTGALILRSPVVGLGSATQEADIKTRQSPTIVPPLFLEPGKLPAELKLPFEMKLQLRPSLSLLLAILQLQTLRPQWTGLQALLPSRQ